MEWQQCVHLPGALAAQNHHEHRIDRSDISQPSRQNSGEDSHRLPKKVEVERERGVMGKIFSLD